MRTKASGISGLSYNYFIQFIIVMYYTRNRIIAYNCVRITEIRRVRYILQ